MLNWSFVSSKYPQYSLWNIQQCSIYTKLEASIVSKLTNNHIFFPETKSNNIQSILLYVLTTRSYRTPQYKLFNLEFAYSSEMFSPASLAKFSIFSFIWFSKIFNAIIISFSNNYIYSNSLTFNRPDHLQGFGYSKLEKFCNFDIGITPKQNAKLLKFLFSFSKFWF